MADTTPLPPLQPAQIPRFKYNELVQKDGTPPPAGVLRSDSISGDFLWMNLDIKDIKDIKEIRGDAMRGKIHGQVWQPYMPTP